MDGPAFAEARAMLGKSRRELAAILGLSPKAVESYEQGWRKVPDSIERMLYFLVLKLRGASAAGLKPCWELRGCAEEARSSCVARIAGEGSFCWFLTGRTCASASKAAREEGRAAGARYCYSCPAFSRLLERAGLPRGFAAKGD
jgi:DNA-binding XRE family transcriptional regulator